MISVEEKIEDNIKITLTNLGLKYYTKTEMINDEIENALKSFPSKSGGEGGNRPDIKLLINNIPIMIEVKGKFDDIIKRKIGVYGLELDMSAKGIVNYAVNGAIHYAHAILTYTQYEKVIAIGVAGNNINNINIWSYLVDRENHIMLKNYSNKNELTYLRNLEKNINENISN